MIPRQCCVVFVVLIFGSIVTQALAQNEPIEVGWLGAKPSMTATGLSWGVPMAKGQVPKTQAFALATKDGKGLPLQSWPLAYWADGSIKWMGFSTSVPADTAGPFNLTRGAGAAPAGLVKVSQTPASIEIDTGWMKCVIPTSGANLFNSMTVGGVEIAKDAQLECILQNGPELDSGLPPGREKFISNIEKVTVEQSGPVRAVVKFEGKHKSTTGTRAFLPFAVRLYFFSGDSTPVRMVHTFFFDGNEKQDFIRGLGVTFTVPFREEIHNRHVRFSGEGLGVWAEPIQPLTGWNSGVNLPPPPQAAQPEQQPGEAPARGGRGGGRGGRGGPSAYPSQLAGERLPPKAQFNQQSQDALTHYPSWGDFRLIQPNADGFTIEKRTTAQAAWIPAASGKRSTGLAYIGDVSGGLAVGLKDFWQSYPSELEILGGRSEAAKVKVWLWAPSAPAMDLRHYDTVARPLAFTYEDAEEDLSTSTPFGVARTNELTLFPVTSVPNNQHASNFAQTAAAPPLLVATPQYLAAREAFGIWSPADRSTPLKAAIEDYLDSIITYYQKQIDQHNWYGFWDFGDVMHSYDSARNEWKYDVGGFAWDNSEQGTDMVLWYMFLRNGRADIFRMAEAMSRHTGEVDCYHFGPQAGLGSRHNIRHWGCGSKEARISMAPYRRFQYYLTTDERTGDQMREMLQADESIKTTDPMRRADPITEADKAFPARVRAGPDWFAIIGNWMTEWERTGDTKWRDRMYAGFTSIESFPFKISTSRNLMWYFWPDTGKLQPRDASQGGYNLVNQMGGPEIIFEMNEMVEHPGWIQAWREYCERAGGGRFAGYMYRLTKDPQWAQRAQGTVLGALQEPRFSSYKNLSPVAGPEAVKPLDEGPNGLVVNGINQSTLQLIQVLAMIQDQLPENAPPQGEGGGGRGRGGRGGGRGARGPADSVLQLAD